MVLVLRKQYRTPILYHFKLGRNHTVFFFQICDSTHNCYTRDKHRKYNNMTAKYQHFHRDLWVASEECYWPLYQSDSWSTWYRLLFFREVNVRFVLCSLTYAVNRLWYSGYCITNDFGETNSISRDTDPVTVYHLSILPHSSVVS